VSGRTSKGQMRKKEEAQQESVDEEML